MNEYFIDFPPAIYLTKKQKSPFLATNPIYTRVQGLLGENRESKRIFQLGKSRKSLNDDGLITPLKKMMSRCKTINLRKRESNNHMRSCSKSGISDKLEQFLFNGENEA